MNTTSTRSVHVDETLDCTGLLCPMPIIKTQQAIKKLASGQVLEMIATDPGSIPLRNLAIRRNLDRRIDDVLTPVSLARRHIARQ